jgi:hypothetical protein
MHAKEPGLNALNTSRILLDAPFPYRLPRAHFLFNAVPDCSLKKSSQCQPERPSSRPNSRDKRNHALRFGWGRTPAWGAAFGRVELTWMILLIGLIVGIASGVVGIGGGILFVPALIWLLGMDQHKAQGTSLGALLLPVGLFAFIEYYRKGNADIRVAALLAAGFLVGGYFGAVGAQHIPDLWLRRIFAIALIGIGGKLLFSH